jgi:hypothetical protein
VKKIFASSVVAIFCFLSLEFCCFIFHGNRGPVQDVFLMQTYDEILGAYDEHLLWRLKDVKPDFHNETYKIICLSDSVSIMYGGNKEYPYMLENKLKQSFPQETFKVFNAGVPGYSSHQGYIYLKKELIRYNPDFVTINFGPNDHSAALNGLEDKEQLLYKPFFTNI